MLECESIHRCKRRRQEWCLTFCIAEYIKAAKRNAINPSITNLQFVGEILDPIIDNAKIKDRNGLILELDAQRTSKLLNCKIDVPANIRKALDLPWIKEKAEQSFRIFLEDRIYPSNLGQFKQDIRQLLSSDENVSQSVKSELFSDSLTDIEFLTEAYFLAIRLNNNEAKINKSKLEANVVIGDIFSFVKKNATDSKNIIVIPINSNVDTTVTEPTETQSVQIVSENTLHGKWITRMCSFRFNEKTLREKILSNLENKNCLPDIHGEYPLGTSVFFDCEEALYLLLVVSRFDDCNRAQSTRKNVKEALNSLFSFYDTYGQGMQLFLPLIGTGLSRSGYTHDESFKLIQEMLNKQPKYIKSKATIVVLDSDAPKISSLVRN